MAGTAQRVIKNTGYLYAKMGVTMFISLYVTRLILNSLGAADFGIYNIVGGAIAMLGFLNSAMAGATQRFLSYAEGEGDREKQKSIFNVSVVLHALIAVVMLVVFMAAGYFFFDGILNIPADRVAAAKVVYASLIVSTMLTIVNVPYDAVMNAHENMRYYAVVGIVESLLKLSVAFACVYASGDKLVVYGALMAAIPLVTLTVMKVYCHRHYEECTLRPRRYWSRPLMKEMTAFAGWNLLGSMSSMVGFYGSSIVVNHAHIGHRREPSGRHVLFANWDVFLGEYFLTAGQARRQLLGRPGRQLESFARYAPTLHEVLAGQSAVRALEAFDPGDGPLGVLAVVLEAPGEPAEEALREAADRLVATGIAICREISSTPHLAVWRRYLRSVWLHR